MFTASHEKNSDGQHVNIASSECPIQNNWIRKGPKYEQQHVGKQTFILKFPYRAIIYR